MIKIENVQKKFGDITALENISIEITDSTIYGLVGSNGAGKSTLLKILCGAYKSDTGFVEINGKNVYDNADIKNDIIYLSDDQYFVNNSNLLEMSSLYSSLYKNYNETYFNNLCEILKLDKKRKINTFSKGMQKQASILLGLSARPKYLFCDETFDGLDPVMRQYVKRLLALDTAEYKTTTIIASHNLRELEDLCDHIGVLHKGGILFERDLDDLKSEIHNFQCSFGAQILPARETFNEFDIVSYKTLGSVIKMSIRGDKDEILAKLSQKNPILLEALPLTLEEIFIEEMENNGYDFDIIK